MNVPSCLQRTQDVGGFTRKVETMPSLGALARSLIVIVLLYAIPAFSDGVQSQSSCVGVLPNSLENLVKEQYRGWQIVSVEMLKPHHRKLFLKDRRRKCPGIAKVDLYGDGRQVYAVVLIEESDIDRRSKLVLTQETGKDKWQMTTLEDETTVPIPVVAAGPAGTYEHVYGERELKSDHEVVVYIGYESWVVVYAWNGKQIEKIQISD
jgi:hypothetical protein